MSYSLAAYSVGFFGYDEFHFFGRELLVAIVGIIVIWLFAQLDPDKSFQNIGLGIFLLSLLLMVGMHFLPTSLVSSAGGA